MGKMDGTDADAAQPYEVEDDPYAELFADCATVEDVLQLQREIEEAEASGS